MRQISEADKRNAEKVDECNRNMEIQVTQLTDGLAGMKDMVERIAGALADDRNARTAQLQSIDDRFNKQHELQQEQQKQQTQQMADVTKLLAKLQGTIDIISTRLPDEPAAKIRRGEDDSGGISD